MLIFDIINGIGMISFGVGLIFMFLTLSIGIRCISPIRRKKANTFEILSCLFQFVGLILQAIHHVNFILVEEISYMQITSFVLCTIGFISNFVILLGMIIYDKEIKKYTL